MQPTVVESSLVVVGSTASDITAPARAGWVTAFGFAVVVEIDPTKNEVIGTLPDVAGAFMVAGTDEDLWLTHIDGNFVSHVALDEGKTTQVDVGVSPSGIAVDESGVWVANNDDGTVSRIDPATEEVVATIEIGPIGLSDVVVAGDGSVWVAAFEDGLVYRIDPEANEVASDPVSVGASAWRMAAGEGAVWSVDPEGGTVSRMAVETSEVETVEVGTNPAAIASAEGWLWVADASDGTLYRIDPVSSEATKTVRVEGIPVDLSWGAEALWVLWYKQGADEMWVTRVELSAPSESQT